MENTTKLIWANKVLQAKIPQDYIDALGIKTDCSLFWEVDYRSRVAVVTRRPRYIGDDFDRLTPLNKNDGIAVVPQDVAKRLKWKKNDVLTWSIDKDQNVVLKKGG